MICRPARSGEAFAVVLLVHDAGGGRHPLHLAGADGAATAAGVAVRDLAVAHNVTCIEAGVALGSRALTVWIADGSNFAGQSSLAAAFDRRLKSWRTYGLGATLHAFLSRSIHAQGSAVTVHDTDGSVLSGSFAGLEESDGALRLRLADGSERVIRAGDIS
jgi:hypothetical protein